MTGKTLRVHEEGSEGVEYAQKSYGSSFPRYSSRFINWELSLVHPGPGRRVDFQIEAVYYNPDGSEMGRSVVDTFVGDTWLNSQHYQGRGSSEPGNWSPGRYRVDLCISGVKKASGLHSSSFNCHAHPHLHEHERPPQIVLKRSRSSVPV